jgi:glycosyltransferase involved in cell wall biosynthesis
LQPFNEILYVNGLKADLHAELKKGYDVLHLEQLWTGWLGFDIPRTLLNIHHFEIIDWENKKLNGLNEKKTFFQMKRATYKIIKNTKNMRMFTHRLLEKAKSINPEANYWVVPFALDLSLYPMQPLVKEPVVGLFGSMHWEPSRSAAERLLTRIWPMIKKQAPHAKLLIAGWNAKKYLSKYMPLPDVTLEENLPHPTDFFSRVAVMVYAPSRSSGMKIKVMESMAYGVPVVTTWEGVEGIEYQNSVQCYVEETDEDIAVRASALLLSAEKRELMRDAARNLLGKKYSIMPTLEKMIEIYTKII